MNIAHIPTETYYAFDPYKGSASHVSEDYDGDGDLFSVQMIKPGIYRVEAVCWLDPNGQFSIEISELTADAAVRAAGTAARAICLLS